MKGMTSIIRREPVGVIAQVAPWNYPMMMAVWKFARHRRRQHGGAEAVRHDAGHHDPPGRDRGGVPATWRLQCDLRRPRHRPDDGHARRAVDGVDHGFGPSGYGGGTRGRLAQARLELGARPRSWCSTARTSPPRPRASPSPGTSTPVRTARPPPGHRRARRLQRLRRRAHRAGQGARGRVQPMTPTCCTDRSTTRRSSSGWPVSSSARPTMPAS